MSNAPALATALNVNIGERQQVLLGSAQVKRLINGQSGGERDNTRDLDAMLVGSEGDKYEVL